MASTGCRSGLCSLFVYGKRWIRKQPANRSYCGLFGVARWKNLECSLESEESESALQRVCNHGDSITEWKFGNPAVSAKFAAHECREAWSVHSELWTADWFQDYRRRPG